MNNKKPFEEVFIVLINFKYFSENIS